MADQFSRVFQHALSTSGQKLSSLVWAIIPSISQEPSEEKKKKGFQTKKAHQAQEYSE